MNEIYIYIVNNVVNPNVLVTKCGRDSKIYQYTMNNVVNKNVLRTISANNEEESNPSGNTFNPGGIGYNDGSQMPKPTL